MLLITGRQNVQLQQVAIWARNFKKTDKIIFEDGNVDIQDLREQSIEKAQGPEGK